MSRGLPRGEVLYEMLLEMSKENVTGKLFPVTVTALKFSKDGKTLKRDPGPYGVSEHCDDDAVFAPLPIEPESKHQGFG